MKLSREHKQMLILSVVALVVVFTLWTASKFHDVEMPGALQAMNQTFFVLAVLFAFLLFSLTVLLPVFVYLIYSNARAIRELMERQEAQRKALLNSMHTELVCMRQHLQRRG